MDGNNVNGDDDALMYLNAMNSTLTAKQSQSLHILFAINCLIDLVGMLMDASIVWVTIKHRSLQHTCHILLAICSLSTAIYDFSDFIPFITAILPSIPSIPLRQCFLLQIVPIFTTFSTLSLYVAIAADRWLAVFMPIKYKCMHKTKCYIACLLLITTIFPSGMLYAGYAAARRHPELPGICMLSDVYQDNTTLVALCALVSNLLTAILYVSLWLKLRHIQRQEHQTPPHMQSIFKSLAIIVAIQVGGFCLSELAFGIIFSIEFLPEIKWHSIVLVNCMISASAAANAPVLYTTSLDYRRAFQSEFRLLFRIATPNQTITLRPTTQVIKMVMVGQTQRRHTKPGQMDAAAVQ